MADNDKLAIVVGGGPAPGINSVIGAATIRACLSGIEVVGIMDGFSRIMKGDTSTVRKLDIESVSRVHFRGGSVLRTARANPTKDPKTIAASLDSLKKLGVGKLITIGGDDTAFSALTLADHSKGSLRVVHVPKTIDNDLDLPDSIPTFGYQTARHVGTGIVQDLLTDAQTTSRWYFVIAMGRKAGHLALGIGKAAGATLTIIPEEFGKKTIPLDEMADILVGAIVKRLAHGRQDGVAVLAEGLVEHLTEAELKAVAGDVELDEHGHIRMAEIEFGPIIKTRVQEKLQELGIKITIVPKNIGYELRCTDPIPFDMEYTRDLGYCAAKYLIEGGSGAMVTVQQGKFKPIKFSDMLDPETGKTRVRMVNVDTESYKIARRYMIRLRKDDFDDVKELESLAKTSKLPPAEFRKRFEYIVSSEAPPLAFNYP
ncbi:MAG TPA: diphosphate--fructose-6-phosphate 1-phosphotransferase [Candidatus Eisenbacteria bacterium]|nr:diphosphate--fructose-6-phosphate 1-phosphotransferase [Candidatus Eisenbacteria bacterium]